MKTCPYCAEEIQDAAAVCKHCGRDLKTGATQVQLVAPKKRTSPLAWGCLGLILLTVLMMIVGQCDSGGRGVAVLGPTANPSATATTATVTGCQPHIELESAAFWAKELGRSETWVLQNHRINLWANSGSDKGQKVGEMIPGSRAVVLEKAGDNYKVRSPLDGSVGWINDLQIARTLNQDVETRKPCTP